MLVYNDLEGDIPGLFEATVILLMRQKNREKTQRQDNPPPNHHRTEGLLTVRQEL